MAFWDWITGGSVEGVLKGAGSLAKDIRSAVTGEISPEDRARLEQQAAALEAAVLSAEVSAQLAQIEVNKADAASNSNFRGGWRPAIGWICGVGLATYAIAIPIFQWVCAVKGWNVVPPKIDFEPMWAILMGMLGLGGYRTFEKVKKIS